MKKSLFILLMAMSLNVYAGNAYFTGQSERIDLVSWNCEYSFKGILFSEAHLGFCPMVIKF